MSETLVKVEGVSKRFCRSLKRSLWYGMCDLGNELLGRRHGGRGALRPEEFWAVKGIDFELKRGECLGLIGPNGAGKSTVLKMLNGLIKPDKGTMTIRGRMGALIELGAGFNPVLTGRENIYVNGAVLGFSREQISRKFDDIVSFAEIGEFLDTPVMNYSSGMKVRLGFAVAAQMEPDVLIIDEVLAVGDVGFRVKCLNRIHDLLDKTAVIFVTHSMPFVARICSQVLVMKRGENVFYSNDIGAGLNYYHSQFDSGKPVLLGSGEVEIKRLTINGQNEWEVPTVTFGNSLMLDVELLIRAKCSRLASRIAIWNADQRSVLDVVSEGFQSFTWRNDHEALTLRIEIPELRLSSGKHSITLVVFDPETTRVLCRVENVLSFIMGFHMSTACDVFHEARWTRF